MINKGPMYLRDLPKEASVIGIIFNINYLDCDAWKLRMVCRGMLGFTRNNSDNEPITFIEMDVEELFDIKILVSGMNNF